MSARLETLTGLAITGFCALFVGYAAFKTDSSKVRAGYDVSAFFSDVSGINEGADVRMSGVKIGSVADVGVDMKSYQAQVTLNIRDDIKIPTDSALKIASDGILGGSYLAVQPGAEDKVLKQGDRFEYTQSAVSLTDLLSRAVFSAGSDEKTGDDEEKKSTTGAVSQ
jgi:phospholipid/cholesterol/gamma-HCH transport system substrate-binding protein